MSASEQKRSACVLCGSTSLSEVFELKNFPHTGIYLKQDEEVKRDVYFGDNRFLVCDTCQLGQLENVLDLDFHYDPSRYWLRTSTSAISRAGSEFFAGYLKTLLGDQKPKRLLEIGCNDLHLLKQIHTWADQCVGVDPIWKDQKTPDFDNVKVKGDFAQNVDFDSELGGAPEVIVSEHTFEHIHNPGEVFESLIDIAADQALFVIEIPGMERLVDNLRFDQVFHQHLNYFNVPAFTNMIERMGCHYVDHCFNETYWGSLIFAFRKGQPKDGEAKKPKSEIPDVGTIREFYSRFKDHVAVKRDELIRISKTENVYGFGAAQMLATLAYQMETDLGFLSGVLDDDERKWGMKYPNLDVLIRKPSEVAELDRSTVAILAQDYMRILMKRVLEIEPKRIVIPMPII